MKSPHVEQFRNGGVLTEVRLLAAIGALPLATDDLVELLVVLAEDSNLGVRDSSLASKDLLLILSNRETPGLDGK